MPVVSKHILMPDAALAQLGQQSIQFNGIQHPGVVLEDTSDLARFHQETDCVEIAHIGNQELPLGRH